MSSSICGTFHSIEFVIHGEDMSDEEIAATIEHFQGKYPDLRFKSFDFTLDGEYVDVKYTFDSAPIQRIRRITGYLVGTLDRFNDAKKAEVADRVKHM